MEPTRKQKTSAVTSTPHARRWNNVGIYSRGLIKTMEKRGYEPADFDNLPEGRSFRLDTGENGPKVTCKINRGLNKALVWAVVNEIEYEFKSPVKIVFSPKTSQNNHGTYHNKITPRINMYIDRRDEFDQTKRTLLHEIGHYHDAHYLTLTQKAKLTHLVKSDSWFHPTTPWKDRAGEYYANLFADYHLKTDVGWLRHPGLKRVSARTVNEELGQDLFKVTQTPHSTLKRKTRSLISHVLRKSDEAPL